MEQKIVLVTILSIITVLSVLSLLVGFYTQGPSRKSLRVKKVHTFGLCLAGVVLVGFPVCFILLPLAGVKNAWLIELVIAEAAIIIYYVLSLYFRTLQLGNWLQKSVAYIVIMSSAAVLYMIIFYAVYRWLFKINNAPTEVFVLNFIMIVLILLLLPLIWELFGFVRSLISSSTIDLTYVVKKLSKFAVSNAKADEVADFLASYMHYRYVGIFYGEKLYGSKDISLTKEDLLNISRLKSAEHFWQEVPDFAKEHGVVAIAELKNARGGVYGQMLIGAPIGKKMMEKGDLAQMEMIVNLVSAVFDSEQRTGYKRKAWRKK